jgi:hypothetical protein
MSEDNDEGYQLIRTTNPLNLLQSILVKRKKVHAPKIH